MKNTLRILAVAMVAVMLCLTLASCGGPNPDPDKALESLKENGVTFAGKDTLVIPTALKVLGVDGISSVVSGTGKIDDKFLRTPPLTDGAAGISDPGNVGKIVSVLVFGASDEFFVWHSCGANQAFFHFV